MGTTHTETGVSKVRNHTTLCPVIYYPILVLSTLTGFAIGSNAYTQATIDKTLQLCNERPLECKFKYDIIKYEKTGQIPYKK